MDTVIHEFLKHMNFVFLFTQDSLCVLLKVLGWSSLLEVICFKTAVAISCCIVSATSFPLSCII